MANGELQLSPQAQQSLVQISQHTLDNFGERQKKRYLKMLRDRIRDSHIEIIDVLRQSMEPKMHMG